MFEIYSLRTTLIHINTLTMVYKTIFQAVPVYFNNDNMNIKREYYPVSIQVEMARTLIET